MRVAIVGAGLGGLCLAQGLGRFGVECQVFERDSGVESRTQGYRIRIDARGQRSLAECLPGELSALFRDTAAVARSGGRFVDTGLNDVAGRAVESWRDSAREDADDDGDLSVNRQTLREILMRGIEDRIRFGRALIRVEERTDGVTAYFRDGSSADCDVLVAADGVHSAVRRQLRPETDPADTGMVCVYGRATLDAGGREVIDETLLDGTSVVFADGFAAIVDAMTFRPNAFRGHGLTPVDDYLYWACFGPRALFGSDAGTDADRDLPATIARITADWHPGLRAVLIASDPNALAALPIRSAGTLPHWPGRRITGLGDAVHAMSPAGGLGANTALRDAATLAELLTAGELTSVGALAEYERRMRAYAIEAVAASERGTARLTAAMN